MASTLKPNALRRIEWLACCLILACIVPQLARAQTYPTKPIRVIITLSPGSANDIIPQFVLDRVAQSVGQPFIFENRPGASGTIAANAVAKANPDGYTILALSTTHAMAPGVIKKIPYETAGDFAGITTLARLPHLLVTGADQKVRSNSGPRRRSKVSSRRHNVWRRSRGGSASQCSALLADDGR